MGKEVSVRAWRSALSLLVDLQGAQTEGSRRRGIGRYTRDLVAALIARTSDDIHLAWNAALETPIADITPVGSVRPLLISAPYGAIRRQEFAFGIFDCEHDINDNLLRHAIARSGARHVLFSSLMEIDSLDFVLPKNLNFGPSVTSYAIVYDIIPYLFPEQYLATSRAYSRYLAHLHSQLSADILFAISEKTRSDLIEVLGVDPAKIITIGTGIDIRTITGSATPEAHFRQRYGLDRPFCLFLGGDEFRKNLPGLIKALGYLPDARKSGLQALIGGKVTYDMQMLLRDAARNSGLPQDALVFAGHLLEEDLRCAYAVCAVTVIPSLYEGFGLPVLEAMAGNCPVIASKNTSMAEILTHPAFLFDAMSPQDIARTIEYVLKTPVAVDELRATYRQTLAVYNWDGVAERVLRTFSAVDNRSSGESNYRTGPESLHVATFGPLPMWCQDLVMGLAADHLVTLYCRPEDVGDFQQIAVALHNLDMLPQRPGALPGISFVQDAAGLKRLFKSVPVADHVVILENALCQTLNLGGVDFSSMAGAYRIFVHTAHGLVRGKVEAGQLVFRDMLGGEGGLDGKATAMALMADCASYVTASSYHLARKLSDTLKQYNRRRLAGKVAHAAAVSVFETHPLPGTGGDSGQIG